MQDEIEVRREKLQKLQERGIAAYPSAAVKAEKISAALEHFEVWAEKNKKITLAGRIMTTRVHGGLIFFDLRDATGKIQCLLKQDQVDAAAFETFRDLIDPADFVSAHGTFFTTNRGEKTLLVAEWTLLAKALRPLPEKYHGLKDVELRFRRRELDLIANPEVRDAFRKRSLIIRTLRDSLEREGFEEVETPLLQPVPGGATAKPFITHHNALDLDLYLRIAPELYLKRLIVGGYEKVYEIGTQFRNEGIDWSHNPEFTSLEFYWAYQDYAALMVFTEKLLCEVVQKVNGSLKVTYQGETLDFTPPWPRRKFADAVLEASGVDVRSARRDEIVKRMQALKIECDYKGASLGKLYDELYKETVRKNLIQPTFIIDHPLEMEPLAKKCADDPRFVQRFQLVTVGAELLKAYTELNDPVDQLARFSEQQAARDAGDEEAHSIDMAFVEALEHGLPPTAGWGMGLDRFAMLLTDMHNIKEVILFPTLRPEEV